jgi:hypothetical protein
MTTTAQSKPSYSLFLQRKTQIGSDGGFDPVWMPDFLFPFQRSLVEWSLKKGRAAIFADCGLGKTPMQLVWAQNVVEKTCKPVLVLTPLSVGAQTVREAHKFGIEAHQSRDGKVAGQITVTNYQQLHKFDWKDFGGCVCDESSILKNFDGQIKGEVTEFMRKLKYRLLCTATASPNDHVELGTSSEALGYLRRVEMLAQFFNHDGGETSKWRIKKHAAKHIFWQWVCSWARAIKRPEDAGFHQDGFDLPSLRCVEHIIKSRTSNPDFLFDMPAVGLDEQRKERRRTINERCEMAAELVSKTNKPAVAWCHLNEEGHLLEKLIPDAVEVEGSDSDEFKEEAFDSFASGKIRVLISKPVIAGFGLNWQHCAHQTFFPSHSFEQWYQAIRRCWRFGQKNEVKIDVIASEGEQRVLASLNRKAEQADMLFRKLVELINNEITAEKKIATKHKTQTPSWL